MILEFHGQYVLFTKVMSNGKNKRSINVNTQRNEVMDEYGMGDLGRGESADE